MLVPVVPTVRSIDFPSGRNSGQRCPPSPVLAPSSAVTGVTGPPALDTRDRPTSVGANTIVSSGPHVPPKSTGDVGENNGQAAGD